MISMYFTSPVRHLFIAMLVFAITGCNRTAEESRAAKTEQDVISLPGWVQVDYGIDDAYLAEHGAKMYDSYDEYVGDLFDNGMTLVDSHWYKPTYGNQNIIWVKGADLGSRIYHKLAGSANDEAFIGTRTEVDTLNVNGVNWQYAGNMQTVDRGKNHSDLFQDFVFFCEKDKGKGISLFYWGDEMLVPAYKNQSLISMLTMLSPRCT